jgi:hypothetical protein
VELGGQIPPLALLDVMTGGETAKLLGRRSPSEPALSPG